MIYISLIFSISFVVCLTIELTARPVRARYLPLRHKEPASPPMGHFVTASLPYS